ncbi:MAG: 5'-methylthioadenosine/adenosylhomocysteine nucleosidase [Pseudomonadota bacterium]
MNDNERRPIGLIAAVPQELAALREHFRVREERHTGGTAFLSGELDDVPVVAAECGIGKVNASLIATELASRYDSRALVFSGVAGSLDEAIKVGDVVVADRLICHDYGAVIDQKLVRYQPGVPPLPDMPREAGYDVQPDLVSALKERLTDLEMPPLPADFAGPQRRSAAIHFGTVLTGDQFVNCSDTRLTLRAEFDALAVEMEGAAVAQIASAFDIPAIAVRAMSDLAGTNSHLDFATFLSFAAEQAATVVRALVPAVDDWQG